jgi:hypothetical protein
MSALDDLTQSIVNDGYAFVRGSALQPALEASGSLQGWPAFAASWNALEVDSYLADRARFRRRRYAVYEWTRDGGMVRQTHQPHHQQIEYNTLFGGVERWFEPVLPAVGEAPGMQTVLAFCASVFGGLAQSVGRWHIEVHQFRIEARAGEQGLPTPEGVHRDGVDFVLVLLVNRCNIASGTTTVHGLDGGPLGSFTLTDPFDAAFVDDRRVAHGVTAVTPIDPTQPAHRDVLVVTFRRAEAVP